MEFLRYRAALPGGDGEWNLCGILPHYPGAVGSGTAFVHRFIALGQWAVELLMSSASLTRGNRQ